MVRSVRVVPPHLPRHAAWACAAVIASSSWLTACVGVGRDLHTVSALYRDARYEVAQAWCSALSVEYADMTPQQRTTYHYLSGMTAYRLSQPSEAVHELALAAHGVRESSTALDSSQLAVLYRTLEALTWSKQGAAPSTRD